MRIPSPSVAVAAARDGWAAGAVSLRSWGLARTAGAALCAGVIGAVAFDALVQSGAGPVVRLAAVGAVVILLAAVVVRSSSGMALGLVALTIAWAVARASESATAAVLVGAGMSVVAVVVSWLDAPRDVAPKRYTIERFASVVAIMTSFVACGLVLMRLVERQPLGSEGAIIGVASLLGMLMLFFVLAGRSEPSAHSEPT